MHIWTDAKGRQWPLHFDWSQVRRMRSACQSLDELLARMHAPGADEIAALAEVLLVCLRQTEPELTDAEFAERTAGCFQGLCQAFVSEFENFFQRQGLRKVEETPQQAHREGFNQMMPPGIG